MPSTLTPEERAALERLITVAQGESGQCARVANFLLAWWNAEECGGLDLTDIWRLDTQLQRDVVSVFGFIARVHTYPDSLGYKAEFQAIIKQWRSEALPQASETGNDEHARDDLTHDWYTIRPDIELNEVSADIDVDH